MAKNLLQKNSLNIQHWRYYIEQEIGFILPDVQLQWLMNAVVNTATTHDLTTAQLWTALSSDNDLRQQLLDAVIIPETRFFRHIPSIEFVTDYAVEHQQQACVEDSVSDASFRIWSVGCASGQEVWSLAMSLTAKNIQHFSILGTDVSKKALSKARLGRYDDRQHRLIPNECQQFIKPLVSDSSMKTSGSLQFPSATDKLNGASRPTWQVAKHLQSHVEFAWHNVFTPDLPTPYLQNVIICQNMLLYFRKFDQRDILTRLSARCALGGYMVLAPGEALFWRPSNMRRIAHPQINAWQKISA